MMLRAERKFAVTMVSLWLAVLLGLCVLLVNGCASTPDTAAFKTLTATQVTVEQALGLWDVYLQTQAAAGKPVPLSAELRVKAAYDRYQKTALVLADAGAAYTRARAQGNEATSRSLYDLALTGAANAKGDLLAVIESFGVRLAN